MLRSCLKYDEKSAEAHLFYAKYQPTFKAGTAIVTASTFMSFRLYDPASIRSTIRVEPEQRPAYGDHAHGSADRPNDRAAALAPALVQP
jgi:hypothetical protein